MGIVERELKNIDKQIKQDKRNVKAVKQVYATASDNIEELYASFFGKHSSEDTIDMSIARQKATKKDIAKYKRDAKKIKTSRGKEEARSNRTNNRLELLKANANLELIEAAEREAELVEQAKEKQIHDEYLRQSVILGVALLFGNKWLKQKPKQAFDDEGLILPKFAGKIPHISYTKKTLKELINTRLDNAVWSDRIWTNQKALRRDLETILERGIQSGTGPRKMAEELRSKVNASVYNSERLMRTESGYVQIMVQKESYKEMEVEWYTIVTEWDACEICLPFDGESYKVEDMEESVNAPLWHPQCRCSTAAHVPDRSEWEQSMRDRGLYSDEEVKDRL